MCWILMRASVLPRHACMTVEWRNKMKVDRCFLLKFSCCRNKKIPEKQMCPTGRWQVCEKWGKMQTSMKRKILCNCWHCFIQLADFFTRTRWRKHLIKISWFTFQFSLFESDLLGLHNSAAVWGEHVEATYIQTHRVWGHFQFFLFVICGLNLCKLSPWNPSAPKNVTRSVNYHRFLCTLTKMQNEVTCFMDLLPYKSSWGLWIWLLLAHRGQ